MLFLLDTNVLIDAARDYYPLEMVPEFWDWLVYQGTIGNIKMPLEIYEEGCDGNDQLAAWLRSSVVKAALVLAEEVRPDTVSYVVINGYAPDLTDADIITMGRDPFLIAYGLADVIGRCIVTTESSRPTRRRANRHVPDVCSGFGLACCNTFEMTRRLGFRTSWKLPS
ncbi:MAG: DUF4411 family protein [Gemmatimonas sp.]